MSRNIIVYLILIIVVVLSAGCGAGAIEDTKLDSSAGALYCFNTTLTDDSVQITVGTADHTPEFDTVRMEMRFDTAQLSNPVVEMGADFDVAGTTGSQDNIVVGVFGRSSRGSGQLQLATVTFDWTGEEAAVSFVPGDTETGRGSFSLLQGEQTPLNGLFCTFDPDSS